MRLKSWHNKLNVFTFDGNGKPWYSSQKGLCHACGSKYNHAGQLNKGATYTQVSAGGSHTAGASSQ